MNVNTDKNVIVINSSHLPIIRAGFSNFIFLLLTIALILVNQVLVELSTSVYVKIIVFLLMCYVTLKIYTHSVTRLYIQDNKKIIFIGPISKSIIDGSIIEMVRIYGIPTSMTMLIKIKKKGSIIPIFFFFVAISTNCGSFIDTKLELISLFEKIHYIEKNKESETA